MKKTRFSEYQIVKILRATEAGRSVIEVFRENAICSATFYQGKSKYGGMEASDIKRKILKLKTLNLSTCMLNLVLKIA